MRLLGFAIDLRFPPELVELCRRATGALKHLDEGGGGLLTAAWFDGLRTGILFLIAILFLWCFFRSRSPS